MARPPNIYLNRISMVGVLFSSTVQPTRGKGIRIMVFWFSAGLIFIVSCLTLFIPLARKKRFEDDFPEKAIYLDQLLEIDKDLAIGLLDKKEAQLARSEIQRRLTKIDDLALQTPQQLPFRAWWA